jgi:hypothetical protein
MDFEWKFEVLKTCKNKYTKPLCTTDPLYGVMTKKHGVSVCFCRQSGDLGKIKGVNLWILSENLSFFKTHKN